MKIGFIGLGNVGGKLAGSLLRNNFKLTVYDLDPKTMENLSSKKSNLESIHSIFMVQAEIVLPRKLI